MKKFIFLVLIASAFSSCSKEKGCTNTRAENYKESAEEEDGSCYFQRNVYFWTNQSSVTNGGGTRIFVDGQELGILDWDFDSHVTDPSQVYFGGGVTWMDKCVMLEMYRNGTSTHSYYAEKVGSGGATWTGTFSFSPKDKLKIRIGD